MPVLLPFGKPTICLGVILTLFLCNQPSRAFAGKYNQFRNIGDPAPAWNHLPGTDDKTHSLKDLAESEVVVVVFTCNSCPYAVDYEQRINRLAQKYQDPNSKVSVVAINVNKVKEDLPAEMKTRASERGFVFPYLYDETQQIAKDFGAGRTPEFYVLNRARQIVYMGAMDDNTDEAKVKVHYVQEAIDATLQGKPVSITETAPIGCAIRYSRR